MREPDATIARMWLDHTSREIGAIIGRSAEYVRVRAQRLDLPRKHERRGGWQRAANSSLPALSNRGTATRRPEPREAPPMSAARPARIPPPPPRLWASPPLLRFTTCQFIKGHPMLGKWHKCARPTTDGSPWCDEHHAIVYAKRAA